MEKIIKYPRTPHLQGSRLQKGDEDLSQINFSKIKNKYIVIEEKVDGANVGISFSKDGELLLQSRGHYLVGGYRERHYNLFKEWASFIKDDLYNVIKDRYIIYGEWLYAKHTLYYDNLPHYFLEFDVYDKKENIFLDTKSRKELLKNLPIESVPVLKEGKFNSLDEILSFLGDSKYKTLNQLTSLNETIDKLGLDKDKIISETDTSLLMEGIYIKVEENNRVIDRMKYVRYSYKQNIIEDNSNWITRPIVVNKINKELESLFEKQRRKYE